MLKRLMVVAAAMVVLLALAGCDTNNEQQRAVVTVSSMNCNAPAYGDVLIDGGGFVDTFVPAVFQNRPYNSLVTTGPGAPHGDFLITGYLIEWTALDGGAVLPPRVESTSFNIPSGETAGAFVRLVSSAEKEGPVLTPLQGGGTRSMIANITFYGHETGTERDTEVSTSVTVEFAQFVDGTADNCNAVTF